MPENRKNPLPQQSQGVERHENQANGNDERFESDTQKIVRKHLEDKDHVITDEDIANVRVGMVPPQFDAATEARFEGSDAREEAEERLLDSTDEPSEDENLEDEQITPWDTIDPTK